MLKTARPTHTWPRDEVAPECPASKYAGQSHTLQGLIKAKAQVSQATGKGDTFQAMVEVMTKSQALQAAWQRDFHQALIEVLPKCQVLKVTRERHTIQALVEALAKRQSSKTSWPIHMLQPLVKETIVATKESQACLAMSHPPSFC